MIDLRALGALDLRRRDGPELQSVLAQAKRTGLLVYLSLARPHGFHRRDTLIALFWPEHDTEHARNNLRQAIYFLRRSLGEEAIVSRGDEDVGLGEGVLSCDAAQFEAALDAGELERALSLYAGDLLPGFFVEEAPEFDRWLDGERTRLRGLAARACWTLAEAKERAGDIATAAEWGRRALAIAPGDDTQIMRLMQLLARAGDRSGALAAFDAHARQLRAQLEVEPTEAARALADEIRTLQPAWPAPVEAPARSIAAAAERVAHEHGPTPPERMPAAPSTGAPPTTVAVTSPGRPAAVVGPAASAGDEMPAHGYGPASGLWAAASAGLLIGIPVALLAIGLGHVLRPGVVPLIAPAVLIGAGGVALSEATLASLWLVRRHRAHVAAGPSRRVAAGLGFALGVLVALSLAYALAPRMAGTPAPLPPRPLTYADTLSVAVTRFANLTGDATLDPVGRLAQDWVVRRLRSIPEAKVVAIAPAGTADTSLDAVTALAQRTGADVVLFGSYYREGDEVLLAASLVPPRGGRVPPQMARLLIGPVRTARDRPVGGAERLASLVAGAVAGKCLFGAACGAGRRAPMYEARQLFLEAAQAQGRAEIEIARQKYRQAIAVDSMYVGAYTHLAELTSCAQKDSIGEILEARRKDIGLNELLYMRIIRAACHGDVEAVYQLRQQQLQFVPKGNVDYSTLGTAALLSGRLREAETLFRQAGDYLGLTNVLHLEGKIAEELRAADEGRRRMPQDARRPAFGMRGLAALGRTQELEARAEEVRRAGLNQFALISGYFSTTRELAWHGHAQAAREYALECLRELDRIPPAGRADPRYVRTRGEMLLLLGRWGEARRLADAGNPRDPYLVMVRGLAAAGAGDVATAHAAVAALDRLPDAAFGGEIAIYGMRMAREAGQAGVLAALGEKDEALQRLADGQARGTLPRSAPYITHADYWSLHALWHDLRFERMFAARD